MLLFQVVIKQKLLNPILQSIFPVLTAAPPPGEEDPEDKEDNDDDGDDSNNDSPKHLAAQVTDCLAFVDMFFFFGKYSHIFFFIQIIDTMALHMPPEKLFSQLVCKLK